MTKPPRRAPRKRSPPQAPDADGQVRHICELMVSGQWRAGTSHKLLRDEWGLSLNTIYDRASTAGQHLRLAEDLKAYVAKSLAELEHISAEARAAGDYSAAVRAHEVCLRVKRAFDPEPTAPTAGGINFPSAREALTFIRQILPGLELAAAAEGEHAPAALPEGAAAIPSKET